MQEQEIKIASEAEMLTVGRKLSKQVSAGAVIFLQGQLGAGKTTLVRGFLRGLGHQGVVKSPTYNLAESYQFADLQVHHFDLYRLADPEELLYLGLEDYLTKDAICLIEWPEKAAILLPAATLSCVIEMAQPPGHRLLKLISD